MRRPRFEPYEPALADGLDLRRSCALPHGASGALMPDLRKRAAAVVDLAADFRLQDAGLYPTWYGEEHPRPSCSAEFVYGLPELFRDELAAPTAVAAPGCYPTAAALALAPLRARPGWSRPTGIVVDAASGVSGAGRPPKPTPLLRRRRGLHRLRPPRPPPHARDRAGHRGADRCFHAPPGADEPGDPRHLLRPPDRRHLDRRGAATRCAGPTPASRSSSWATSRRRPRRRSGSNCAHLTARADPRTGWVVGLCALDNLVKGAAGQAVQCANLVARPRRGQPACHSAGLVPDERHRPPQGLRRRRRAVRHQAVRRPDLALVATADGRAVSRRRRLHVQPGHGRAGAGHPRPTWRRRGGRAAAVVLNSGNANAATGQPGRGDAERTCALVAAELGCRADEVLVCSTGLIGIPLPMDAIERGVPGAGGRARAPTAATARPRPSCTTDTRAQGGRRRRRRLHRRRHGQGRGDARAQHGDDAGRAHHRRRSPTPDVLLAVLQRRRRRLVQRPLVDGCTSTNDTVLLLASGRAGAGRTTTCWPTAVAEACADLARQMAGDAEGATKVVEVVVTGARIDEDARRAARRVAESQLCKCSWYGEDPYWGRIVSELGSSGAAFDPDLVSVPTAASPSAARAWPPCTTPPPSAG